MSVSNILFVLGGESSGKTTLIQQLESLSSGSLVIQPYKAAPTTGQNISHLQLPVGKRGKEQVEVREIGGSMAPHWDRFIKSTLEHEGNARRALLYVVDATAPHQLSEATTRFLQLTSYPGYCNDWPTVLVLHKSHAARAVSVNDLTFLLGGVSPDTFKVLEVDAWNGFGVGDVFDWLVETVFG